MRAILAVQRGQEQNRNTQRVHTTAPAASAPEICRCVDSVERFDEDLVEFVKEYVHEGPRIGAKIAYPHGSCRGMDVYRHVRNEIKGYESLTEIQGKVVPPVITAENAGGTRIAAL